jgi:hypothetical protein
MANKTSADGAGVVESTPDASGSDTQTRGKTHEKKISNEFIHRLTP